MKREDNPSAFPMGNPLPEKFSKYFIGQAYLQPLTEKGGPMSPLNPAVGITGTSITREVRFSL